MTEQERVDEILRMAERYKMDEGRRRLSMVEASQMGVPEPTPLPYSPPVGTAASTGGPTDVFQPEAREYAGRSLEALGRGYQAMEGGIDAAGPELAKHGARFLKGSGMEFGREKINEAKRRYEAGDPVGAAAYYAGGLGYTGLGAIDAYLLGNRGAAATASKEIEAGIKSLADTYRRVVPTSRYDFGG